MRQEDIPTSRQTSNSFPVQIYMDRDRWERFAAVAQAENRTRSAQVRELIDRSLEQFETRAAA
jgi:predicted DNA-binding protein